MDNDKLLGLLEDHRVLLEAQAASSAYVMRKAFVASRELQAFAGRTNLAPALLERVERLTKEPGDPVVLGAHLYALELTGADDEIRAATLQVLGNEALRDDPLAGQFAGQVAARLVRFEDKVAAGSYFEPEELEGVLGALERKEEK
jgi:hypothetical protein